MWSAPLPHPPHGSYRSDRRRKALELTRRSHRFMQAHLAARRHTRDAIPSTRRFPMQLTAAHIAPLTAVILILIVPRLLNYIVAIYLILVGLAGLNSIHHFIR